VNAKRELLEVLEYKDSKNSEWAKGTGRMREWSLPGERATSQSGAGEPLAAVDIKLAHKKLKHESVNLSAKIGSR
jgi:hypothetical protein